MAQLDANWITKGHIDFEYKKYVLLAYLQGVGKHFNLKELYPFLSDLVFHYNNLISLKQSKTINVNKFPKKLTKIEFQNFKLNYESIVEEDKYMEEIEHIIDFSLPMIQQHLKDGKEIFEYVEDQLELIPVGLLPLKPIEGYLFIRSKNQKLTKVYEYAVTIFENTNEKYRGLKTQYVSSYKVSVRNTFENIKFDLIKKNKKLPNPATYAIESTLSFPFTETLFPIAKRVLVKKISENLD